MGIQIKVVITQTLHCSGGWQHVCSTRSLLLCRSSNDASRFKTMMVEPHWGSYKDLRTTASYSGFGCLHLEIFAAHNSGQTILKTTDIQAWDNPFTGWHAGSQTFWHLLHYPFRHTTVAVIRHPCDVSYNAIQYLRKGIQCTDVYLVQDLVSFRVRITLWETQTCGEKEGIDAKCNDNRMLSL